MINSSDLFCESQPTNNKKVIILGSGPNRIGQGIEFDYTCVHAAFAYKEQGIEAIMINCNQKQFQPTTTPRAVYILSRLPPKMC